MKRRTVWLGGGVVLVLVAAATGAAIARGWFGCRPPADQRSALHAYLDDPMMASAPSDARLLQEITRTAACDSHEPQTREDSGGPDFVDVSRIYAVGQAYSESELTSMFRSKAEAAGWRFEQAGSGEQPGSLWFCRRYGDTVAVLSIQSTVQPQNQGDPRLALTIRGVPSRSSC
ncbi:hypothetical protein AB0H43_21045 [Hamadaea sp. NPDC050747]|uniref:hypothetical protein n=1 Tax=Hamadaea sp. NPDC050747 TaxID=3155789 RepID=UPI0033ED4BCC